MHEKSGEDHDASQEREALMKFKCKITYIDDAFIQENWEMSSIHPDFIERCITTDMIIDYPDDSNTTVEQVEYDVACLCDRSKQHIVKLRADRVA